MAQLILNDRVKETTTTTGTGTVNLAGAEEGFETFVAGVGTGKDTFYAIFAGTEFEVGRGTVTDASPDTLSRTTVFSSSNSDNLVNFSAGEKTAICTYPAKKAPSASMDATAYITTHNSTISEIQTIDSAVLAGPLSISGTVTTTGTLIII
jgi:hypothetical protein|tara:strand:- start:582 stop:1034 length:453 start_codon:yes stop_codon:yes gene_type:complete